MAVAEWFRQRHAQPQINFAKVVPQRVSLAGKFPGKKAVPATHGVLLNVQLRGLICADNLSRRAVGPDVALIDP